MADSVYNVSKANITITDLRVLLVKDTYVFDADHEDVADVVANECDFTNYARKALSGEAHTVVHASDTAVLDADDPSTWSNAGGAANNDIGGLIVYEHNVADADAKLVSYHDTGFPISTNGGDLTVSFAAAGIIVTS